MGLKGLALYVILKSKNTAKEVLDYCNKTSNCKNNDIASRVLLELAGYLTSSNSKSDYKEIFRELVKIGLYNNSKNDVMTTDVVTIIKMTPDLKKYIANHGSPVLYKFMLKNDIDLKKEFPGVTVTSLPSYSTKLLSSF